MLIGARRLRWEVLYMFPNRRGRNGRCKGGHSQLSTGQQANKLFTLKE